MLAQAFAYPGQDEAEQLTIEVSVTSEDCRTVQNCFMLWRCPIPFDVASHLTISPEVGSAHVTEKALRQRLVAARGAGFKSAPGSRRVDSGEPEGTVIAGAQAP